MARRLNEDGTKTLLDGKKVYDFYRLLAVCNTVVIEEDPKSGKLSY